VQHHIFRHSAVRQKEGIPVGSHWLIGEELTVAGLSNCTRPHPATWCLLDVLPKPFFKCESWQRRQIHCAVRTSDMFITSTAYLYFAVWLSILRLDFRTTWNLTRSANALWSGRFPCSDYHIPILPCRDLVQGRFRLGWGQLLGFKNALVVPDLCEIEEAVGFHAFGLLVAPLQLGYVYAVCDEMRFKARPITRAMNITNHTLRP
jgi:hypothetical protein